MSASGTAMRLLIVDDEPAVRSIVARSLAEHGVTVAEAGTAAEAMTALHHGGFDVAILDLTLPDGYGLDLLRAVRELDAATHVIILSGAGTEGDRVRALDLGADDYVVKPFFARELVARVVAVRRRRDVANASTLTYGSVTIDLAARQAALDGEPLGLTAKEFDLLAFLAVRPGQAFSRDELLRGVWQSAADWQQASTVTEHIRRLRAKLEPDRRVAGMIQTVRGVGYRFDPSMAAPRDSGSSGWSSLIVVDGVIVSADAAAVVLAGVTSEAALLGMKAVDLVAPGSVTAARLRGEAVVSGRPLRSQLITMLRADGGEAFVEVSSSAAEWQGKPARRIDVRPSPDASAQLRHLVTGVFGDVSDAVIVTDPGLHVRSWNPSAERMYGWAEDEVLGRHLADLIPFVGPGDDLVEAIETLEATGRWFGEARQTAKDGSTVVVSASTTVIKDDSGEAVLVISVNRPVAPAGADPSPASPDEADIRRGVECGEFDVHYQPVVALEGGRLTAVEALVRWNHPDRGILAPAAFIDLAERSGLIVDIGRAVIDKACGQAAAWRREGLDLEVAVNLSSGQLADESLFDDITKALAVSGLEPHALWLEVTETVLVEDLNEAAALLDRLAALGIRIAIDDFGTGWASLTYLKQFPVHALKIDVSFVDGVDHDPQDAAIARSILSLGEELGLMVVAEGVETVAQQRSLQDLGCLLGQGYLYGKPTPAAAVPVDRARRAGAGPPAAPPHNSSTTSVVCRGTAADDERTTTRARS